MIAGFLRRIWRNQRGNVAVIFAIALPALGVLTAGGVELALLTLDRTKMQGVADAAALSGAKELTLAMQEGAMSRAKEFADGELAELKKRSTITVTAQIVNDGSAMKLMIHSHRQSFFGSLLPPGGFNVQVEAVAERMGRVPLCVLSSEVDTSSGVRLKDNAKLTAGQCMVHSNSTIDVNNAGWLNAGMVMAVEEARGRITPAAQVGGQTVEDPFKDMDFSTNGLCVPIDAVVLNVAGLILPGPHCTGNVVVRSGQTVNLAPGVHYFKKGKLELREDAKLTGKDVVLIFDEGSKLVLKDNAELDLEGRKSGKYAGFVIATTHANRNTFEISTDNARTLLGTVYIPSAELLISGTGTKVADQSPWTVIVAETIRMEGAPDLVINADYAGSSTPVPKGVGPTHADARLAK